MGNADLSNKAADGNMLSLADYAQHIDKIQSIQSKTRWVLLVVSGIALLAVTLLYVLGLYIEPMSRLGRTEWLSLSTPMSAFLVIGLIIRHSESKRACSALKGAMDTIMERQEDVPKG